MSNESEIIPHVDADGRFIAWASRKEIHDRKLIHRSINVFVFHPDGRMLVQLRHRTKRNFASYWDVACSGHVDKSDHPNGDPTESRAAYLSAASREIVEEIGISPTLEEVGEFPPVAGTNYERTMIFRCTSTGPFVLQDTEVEEVRWVTREEFKQLHPVTPLLQWMARQVISWT